MTIVVTGGTKGIGLAIAKRLASAGETLVLGYHTDEAAAQAARVALEALGATVVLASADIGTPAGASELIAACGPAGAPITCLVHSAAMIYPTTLLDADPERFTRAVETNGLSLLYLVHAALPRLAPGSSIIFISSAGARVASPRYGALGVGKALAESLIRYLVMELAPRGIRINGVAPGLVRTTSVAAMVGGEDAAEQVFARAARSNPSGRMSEDDDYTEVVAFLAGEGSRFVQGQIIQANGGAFVG
jgi:NAD(P)-dependent dehydrogenase (short-subunit alcohol dehydrogenase family)